MGGSFSYILVENSVTIEVINLSESFSEQSAEETMVQDAAYQEVEKKLLLLYLLDRMDLPLSNAQISEFSLEQNYMDYFLLQQSLSEMVESGYLEKSSDGNHTFYAITDEGLTTLDYFEKHIPLSVRNHINQYVVKHKNIVKRDYEVTANYFYDHGRNEFIIKCGVYEDEAMLMEINLSVVNRDQAKLVCKNWKARVANIYSNIISELAASEGNE